MSKSEGDTMKGKLLTGAIAALAVGMPASASAQLPLKETCTAVLGENSEQLDLRPLADLTVSTCADLWEAEPMECVTAVPLKFAVEPVVRVNGVVRNCRIF